PPEGGRCFGVVPAGPRIRGKDPEGREGGRPADRATDKDPARNQPPDRQGARPRDPEVAARARRPADRVSLTDDLGGFVAPRRRHGGTVTYTVSTAAETGDDLRLRCTCGQSYYVYV